MDKKILNIITIVAFVLIGTNATFANTDEDGFYVQSLNMGDTVETDNHSIINMKKERLPKDEEEEEVTNVLVPQQIYVQPIQYTYPQNYVQYKKVIGPYYTTGIFSNNHYNYKGFGYNYTGHGYNYGYSVTNKRPIFVSPPPPPPNMRPPHHMFNPMGGTMHPHHNHPHHNF